MMEGWKVSTIGEYCEILNGYAFKSEDYVNEGGILNFRVTNIKWDGTIDIENDVEYLPESFGEKFKQYLLKEKDILFVMVGATRGKLAQIPFWVLPALMNQNMWRIVPLNSEIDKNFLYYYLIDTIEYLFATNDDQARGFFKKKDFKEIPFSFPPLPEQYKIAYVLRTVQKAFEHQDKLIRTTTELKKALMQKLFTEGTRGEPQRKTEIGLVPESWEVISINKTKTLMQYGTSVKCDYKIEGVPVVRIPNVISGKVDISHLKFGKPKKNELDKFKLDKGDLLFVRTNGAKELSGRCAIFRNEIDSCYYASYLIRLKLDTDKVDPDFLNYYTQTELGKSFLSGKAIRTADGKYNINTGILNNVLFPKPMLNEQKEIVEIISLIEEKIAIQNKKKQTLTALFKTLLHELMTGQRRVHDLEFK